MKTIRIFLFLLVLLPCMRVWAQENPYGIYPVPHSTQITDKTASVTETVSIIVEDGIDQYTRDRAVQVLEEHGKSSLQTSSSGETEGAQLHFIFL